MANTACWYLTELPENTIKTIIEEIDNINDSNFQDSLVNMKPKGILAPSIRKSKNCWTDRSKWVW